MMLRRITAHRVVKPDHTLLQHIVKLRALQEKTAALAAQLPLIGRHQSIKGRLVSALCREHQRLGIKGCKTANRHLHSPHASIHVVYTQTDPLSTIFQNNFELLKIFKKGRVGR